MEEKWKEYLYRNTDLIEVSTFGNVKRNGKDIPKRKNKDGYLTVSLKSDRPKNPWSTVNIAILVANTFIPKPNDYEIFEVNHKDYNRQNNNVDNLEWMTHSDNIRYSICNKPSMKGDKNPNYGNKKLSKIYKENPQLALEKQSRKGIQNGRCVKIKLYYGDIFIKEFEYIGLCLQYLIDIGVSKCKNGEVLRSQVNKCIKNNTTYKGYRFVVNKEVV